MRKRYRMRTKDGGTIVVTRHHDGFGLSLIQASGHTASLKLEPGELDRVGDLTDDVAELGVLK